LKSDWKATLIVLKKRKLDHIQNTFKILTLLTLILNISLFAVQPTFATPGAETTDNQEITEFSITPIPTSSTQDQPITDIRRPPLWLTLFLLGTCCIMVMLLGIVVLGFFLRKQNRQAGKSAR